MKHIVVALVLVMAGLLCRAQGVSAQSTRPLSTPGIQVARILSATSPQIARILSAPTSCLQSTRAPGIRLELRGIYVLDGLLWFNIRAVNTSVFDWHGAPMRFSIRDRHVLRRRARQELPLTAVARHEVLFVPSDSSVTLIYAFAPRLPGKGQWHVLEYGNRTADRNLVLRLSAKQLLHAKKLDSHGKAQNAQVDQGPQ